MKIREIMNPTVDSIDAGSTIAYAAQRMAEDDVGTLPILDHGQIVGIVTDRDIAVRSVAAGIEPGASIRQVMSKDVATCSPDDDVESVLALMSREQVRRMPVCDGNRQVIGIVGLADVAKFDSLKQQVGDAITDICKPSGVHCQAPMFA